MPKSLIVWIIVVSQGAGLVVLLLAGRLHGAAALLAGAYFAFAVRNPLLLPVGLSRFSSVRARPDAFRPLALVAAAALSVGGLATLQARYPADGVGLAAAMASLLVFALLPPTRSSDATSTESAASVRPLNGLLIGAAIGLVIVVGIVMVDGPLPDGMRAMSLGPVVAGAAVGTSLQLGLAADDRARRHRREARRPRKPAAPPPV